MFNFFDTIRQEEVEINNKKVDKVIFYMSDDYIDIETNDAHTYRIDAGDEHDFDNAIDLVSLMNLG